MLFFANVQGFAQCTNNTVRPDDGFQMEPWNPTCNGGSDGFIKITNIKSTSLSEPIANRPYSVRILSAVGGGLHPSYPAPFPIGNNSTFDLPNLPAGNYVIDITDTCGNTSADKLVTIGQPNNPEFLINTAAIINRITTNGVCGDTYVIDAQFTRNGTGQVLNFYFTNSLGAVYTPTNSVYNTIRYFNTPLNGQNIAFQVPFSFFQGGPITIHLGSNQCNRPESTFVIPLPQTAIQLGGGGTLLTATDNCGTATVTMTEVSVPGTCAGNYILTRTWIATDSCGLTTTHVQTITVQDTTTPTTATTFDSVINVTCESIPDAPQLQFMDNCSAVDTVVFDEEIQNQTAEGYVIIRTWTVQDNCGNTGIFMQTVNVTIAQPVQAIATELCVEDIAIDLFSLLDSSVEITGTWSDTNNSGALQGSTFDPTMTQLGNYILTYTISDGNCPRVYEIEMNVNDDCVVLPCGTIEIFNALTPNDDGLNDMLFIEGIDCYPKNTITIFNRWGVEVFKADGYDNVTKVFRGYSEGRTTISAESKLPTGTYFYILKYESNQGGSFRAGEKSGYLYINGN